MHKPLFLLTTLLLLPALVLLYQCSPTPETQDKAEIAVDTTRTWSILVAIPDTLEATEKDTLRKILAAQFQEGQPIEILFGTDLPGGEIDMQAWLEKNPNSILLSPDASLSMGETPPLEMWSFTAHATAGLDVYGGLLADGATSIDATGQGPLGFQQAAKSNSGQGATMSDATQEAFRQQRRSTEGAASTPGEGGPEPTGPLMKATRQVTLSLKDSTETSWYAEGPAYETVRRDTVVPTGDSTEAWGKASNPAMNSQDEFRLIDRAARFSSQAIRQHTDLQSLVRLTQQYAPVELYQAWYDSTSTSLLPKQARDSLAHGNTTLDRLATQIQILDSLLNHTVFLEEQAQLVLEMGAGMVEDFTQQEALLTLLMQAKGLYPLDVNDPKFIDSVGYFAQHDYFTWDLNDLSTSYQRLQEFSK
ncbi:MAG TPA: hypothetical protein DCE41_02255 [Cytophagales bacterium]|nr:hypothetical protein [Cytophagales bacterium]HAP64377.1 hypothetical protein [Cytophagales bacterium]